MTRINCVPAHELTRQHLVAEYRELPRVFTLAKAAYARGLDPSTCPQQYLLGTGHVKFFYPRLAWLRRRFEELYDEMIARGYTPNLPRDIGADTRELPPEWNRDWAPSLEALRLNKARIAERLAA